MEKEDKKNEAKPKGFSFDPKKSGKIKSYTVKAGDTLSSIAKEFYGDPAKYERIYKVNKTTIGDDPDNLKVGQELKIPPKR